MSWYRSPEYVPLLEIRTKTGCFNTILVDGVREDNPATTGRLDQWELERIAELEAQEQRDKAGD